MLTDDNTEVIEWSDGRIKVHIPERLEAEVLHKYFRHSKVRTRVDRPTFFVGELSPSSLFVLTAPSLSCTISSPRSSAS
jgi:hypothetical protein